MIMNEILKLEDVSIKTDKRLLMRNVSFDISEGENVLLSGENGIGKSTLIKATLNLEDDDIEVDGKIIVEPFGNIVKLDRNELQDYRSQVGYVQQSDDFARMGNVQVRDIISESYEAHVGKTLNASEVNDLIDEWIPRKKDNSRVFEAKSHPSKFSGGEQRLLSVFSVLATRADARLLIIDEPLNNLDYINARNISNIINRVIKRNPAVAILMVSHCRIFPFITREIRLTQDGASDAEEPYSCHSCFGEPDTEGYYL